MNTQITRLEDLIAEVSLLPEVTAMGTKDYAREAVLESAQAAIDAIRAGDKAEQARHETLAFENAVQMIGQNGERLATTKERDNAKRRWTRAIAPRQTI